MGHIQDTFNPQQTAIGSHENHEGLRAGRPTRIGQLLASAGGNPSPGRFAHDRDYFGQSGNPRPQIAAAVTGARGNQQRTENHQPTYSY